ALEYRQARDRVRQLQAQSGRLRATHSVVPNPALAAVADQIDAEVADLAAKAAELNASVESAYRRLAADGAEKKGAGPRVVRGAEAASRPLTGLDAAVAQADAVVAAWRGDEAPPPGRLT
ncbi:MAG TPA: hypothetical protein VNI01_13485, partial [Elusimicrobiota bacterium]|nr:hypothetical protein [Elusimicrobiota bacterium]